jgi:multicomponent K+:H+ antiporter subunit A
MSLALLLALPFVGSAVAALMPANARNAESTWSAVVALVTLVQVALLFPDVRGGAVIREEIAWLPDAGLALVLRIDGFAWMFAMLVVGIGLLVVLYARYYMSPADPVPRFFSFLLAFMGSMLGLVVAGNLIQIVFFWELTSLSSFVLIGYWHHRADARRGARMALIVTGGGGLCLLAGMLLLGRIVGSYDLDAVLKAGDVVRADPLYMVALGLVLLGAFTKSAQFPFQFWLPHAMAAPTPVSAYLHSATMVKAGVFLLARLWPVFAGTEAWFGAVTGVGVVTLLIGAYTAMFQRDLKGLLAYSTISHLGLITLLLGLNSRLAAVAAVFHMMNHATFKAALFMAAGVIDHETGTRDISRLNGLYKAMPVTATLAIVASAAMAGVPLLNGFLSKEMFFAETVFVTAVPWIDWGLPIAATVAGAFAVTYALRFSVDIFFGKLATDLPRTPHEPNRWMRVPIELLVLVCIIVGMFPARSIGPVLAEAARPVVGGTLPAYDLAVWHGFNLPLVMSVVAIAGGIVGYLGLRKRQERGQLQDVPLLARLDGRRLFESALLGLMRCSRRVLRVVSTRRLQTQMFTIIAVAIVLAFFASREVPLAWGERQRLSASPAFVLLWVIGAVCAISAAVMAKFHRLVAITLMGGAGLVTCVTFAWFSAPDLALTQIVVEVVTTTLFLLGLRWLPMRVEGARARVTLRDRARRSRDLLLALAAGGGLAALSYALLTRPAPQSISPFFLSRALPEGGGTNVVNVMLVDFRAFDTIGEITVLGTVALTVYALLRRFRPPVESIPQPQQQTLLPADVVTDLVKPDAEDAARGYLMVPAMIARVLLPVSLVVAAHFLLRGHNAPDGGFVAGLVVAIAMLMQYVVSGTRWVERHAHLRPPQWIGVGLLLAAMTGLGAIAFGYPFLTTRTLHATLPLVGDVHLPTATFFDIGVFAVVVGATLLILTALAHQSIRAHRPPKSKES